MRLTTESGVPVSTSNRSSQGTLYWTPFEGGVATYYTGSVWVTKVQSELSLSLTLTSGKNYDVFYNGTALSLSNAWTNDTTRADALGTQDGVIVLSSDHTKLWIGAIRASGANIIEDSTTKRFAGNIYNVVARKLSQDDATSHTLNNTTQEWRAGTAMRTEFILPMAGQSIIQDVAMRVAVPGAGIPDSRLFANMDGVTGLLGYMGNAYPNFTFTMFNLEVWVPSIGYHYLTLTEQEAGAVTITIDFGYNRAMIFN